MMPTDRIHYTGRWWKAVDEKTLRELRRAMGDGNFASVFAKAALDGRMKAEEEEAR